MIDRGQVIGNGVVMGLAPAEVLDMTLHDYQAALHHFAKSQGAGNNDEPALDDDDFDEMMVGMAAFERSQAVH